MHLDIILLGEIRPWLLRLIGFCGYCGRKSGQTML
jgi:hypothetical protein